MHAWFVEASQKINLHTIVVAKRSYVKVLPITFIG